MEAPPPNPRRRLGIALVVLGIALVLAGVFRVLNAAWGDEPVRTFAQRRSYDEVKVAVHETLPAAALWAAAGLATAWLGSRWIE